MYKIASIRKSQHALFLQYLDQHVAENHEENGIVFQPLSKKDIKAIGKIKEAILNGTSIALYKQGWRRLWLASDKEGSICGHIDLRSLPQANTAHRALLGMGVHKNHRRKGLARKLLEYVEHWCKEKTKLEYIDLQVLANNTPAVNLYKALNYIENGRTLDLFRIEGKSYDFVSMSKKVQ
jgi:ribosomal protein S18 acetylase RimI-like enzyme